jgi:hypothetical protein
MQIPSIVRASAGLAGVVNAFVIALLFLMDFWWLIAVLAAWWGGWIMVQSFQRRRVARAPKAGTDPDRAVLIDVIETMEAQEQLDAAAGAASQRLSQPILPGLDECR